MWTKQLYVYTTPQKQNGSQDMDSNHVHELSHQPSSYSKEIYMTPFKIRKKLRMTAKGVAFGTTCCLCIYGTLLICTAKSMLRMQTTRVDLWFLKRDSYFNTLIVKPLSWFLLSKRYANQSQDIYGMSTSYKKDPCITWGCPCFVHGSRLAKSNL